MSTKIGDKVCRNHPERQAVSRCETCFKPLCPECVNTIGGVDFCSERCQRNYADVGANIADYETKRTAERARRRRRRLVKTVIILIIVAGLAAYAVSRPDHVAAVREWIQDLLARTTNRIQPD